MASESVFRVLDRLENVSELSAGWTALCPAHDDTMNSLSIGQGSDGRALIHCHAGCTFQEVLAAMGLRARNLFHRKQGAR